MLWRTARNFTPPVDIIETEDHIVVLVEVGGMQAGDFNITLANSSLVISGIRRRPPLEVRAYHQVEIGFGEFRVEISLPWALQHDFVSANYHDGFLQVNLPRQPEHNIRVVSAGTEQDHG